MDYFSNIIFEQVKQYNCELVSFDIFDTLVYRRCAMPQQVFTHAFDQVSEQLNLVITAEEYCELRERAEAKARQISTQGEICLNDIFIQLPFSVSINQQLFDAELNAEQQLSFLNQALIKLIYDLQGEGLKVVLISDMYLSSEQIQRYFFESSILEQLPLYVSSELKCTKYSGDLFRAIKGKEQVNYEHWVHIGDNLDSDYRAPNLLGVRAVHYTPALDNSLLNKAEQRIFNTYTECRSIRVHASLNAYAAASPVAYQLGSYTWGPVLVGFADWVIDQTIAQELQDIICITREGKVFQSVIDKRLAARGLFNITTHLLYASRRSTLLASIDVEGNDWLSDMFQLMVLRRDYTIAEFYSDLLFTTDRVCERFGGELLAEAGTLYFAGASLFMYLKCQLEKDINRIKTLIKEQRGLFVSYYNQLIGKPLGECVLLDFGGGGSTHYQLKQALGEQAAVNLLFYSSDRIYRYLSNMIFSAYLGRHSDTWLVRAILNRSCEAIEALFVIHSGSVLGYKESSGFISPIQEDKNKKNNSIANDFQLGIECFIDSFNKYSFDNISQHDSIAILSRFLRYPTAEEAKLYKHIYHPDNLGDNDDFSVVSPSQIDFIRTKGVNEFLSQINKTTDGLRGDTIWPEAVASIISQEELFLRSGLMANEGEDDIEKLLRKIVNQGWNEFSIYGAGQFFCKLAPKLVDFGLSIDCVIDRKAEFSDFTVLNRHVVTLQHALDEGATHFVIASGAFKTEISELIYKSANTSGVKDIKILSL